MKPWIIREARSADLPALTALATPARSTSLALPDSPGERLLVIARTEEDDAPVGCVRIRARIGMDTPRPWFHVGCTVHAAPELSLFHRQTTLQLGHDHTGASELADLRIDTGLDMVTQATATRVLLRAALMAISTARAHHAGTVICELPGLRRIDGRSDFWEGLGRHFHQGSLHEAERQLGPTWRHHVSSLLPRHAIYTAFLPDAARHAIAQTHPDAHVLMSALHDEGLRWGHHVCIDDAGPVFEGHLDTLPSVLQVRRTPLRAMSADEQRNPDNAELWLVSQDGTAVMHTVRGTLHRGALAVSPDTLGASSRTALQAGLMTHARRLD